ncbi:uncharacterized protein [Drosophila kikkawai]|uniref:Uncharacterized protein n=1 Tax=Drosophila kikkawai TaxID=30033 RepID=A0ABM4GFU1_DROKI
MSSTISSPRDDAWMGLALEELPATTTANRGRQHACRPGQAATRGSGAAAFGPAARGHNPASSDSGHPKAGYRREAITTGSTSGSRLIDAPTHRSDVHDAYRQSGAAPTGSTASSRPIEAPAHRPGRHDNYRTRNPIIKGGATSGHHFGMLTHRLDSNNAWDTRTAPDPDGEVDAALRECLGDLPPDVLEEMAHGAEGLDLEDLFGESPDEDGVELPMRPASDQSVDEPRTPSPQFLPDYEVISSNEGEADEIIQISDSDDAEPNFRPPSTPPPAYEDILGRGPYATRCPITTCAASSPSQSPPTTSRGYHAAVAPRQVDGPSTSQLFDLTTDEDSADERPAVAVRSRPPLPTPSEYAAAVARRRAEDLSDELGSSSAGPVRPVNPEPRSARDRPPTPAPARRDRRRSAPWADSPSESSSEEELPRDRQGHTRWLPVPDGWSTPNGTLPAGLIRRIQQRLLVARRRAIRYLEEEQGQRFRVQLNHDDHVRVFPTRK